jgi:phospholipase C
MSNPDANGTPVNVMPTRSDELCALDPPHSWNASRAQFANGANSGFVIAHQNNHPGAVEPMGYMLREHVPVTWALADAYTSCDRWFSSVLGPTLPNRMYWHAGTSNGAKANDEVVGGAFEGVPSIHHRLNEAGIDWAYYYGDVPVLAVLNDLELTGRLRRFMYDFIDDAAAGTLPPVVYIDPGFGSNDDHPPHHPLLGQQLISATYNALATSPQWERCLFVVTYDENGGYYDHVAPPLAADDRAAEGFDQLGFRVPTLVMGPYAKPGYVSSVQYDHTSALKHLENSLGLPPLTARSTAATDLSDCIDFDRIAAGNPLPPITLPAVEIDESMLPDNCIGSSLRGFDHDILAWAETANLGKLDLRRETRDYVYGIAEYLDRHNLGRIRRGR